MPPAGLAELRDHLAAGSPASGSLPISALPITSLGLDSLGRTEFCIHLELEHGVPLTPDRLLAMADLGELLAFLADSGGHPTP